MTISLDEVRDLLTLANGLGSLSVNEARVTAWHQVLTADLPGTIAAECTCPPTYTECRQAVLAYYRHDTGILAPADVWRLVMKGREAAELAEFDAITSHLAEHLTNPDNDPHTRRTRKD